MLAESRSRQKWSHDPRNTNWANDKSKFGYTMLSKMGWSEGKGLGANLTGATSHIKVNKRGSNAGIGLKKSHEDDWIGHQDDFNALLSSLNGKPAAETASPAEKMSKMSKHRYTKFVKSKDLSNASTDDLACIFGVRGKSAAGADNAKNGSEDSSESESASEEEVEGGMKTIESTLNVNEYFAKKMAALKQKNALGNNSPICLSNIKNESVKIEETDDKQCPQETLNTPEPETKKKKKKKSKEVEAETCIEAVCEEAVIESGDGAKKKKKKKKTKESTRDEIEVPSPETSPPALEEETSEVVKKKKKKKKNKENIEEETTTPVVDVVLENGLVTKKKRKRTVDDSEQNVTDTDPVVKKKKKKKSKEVSDAE